MKLSRFMMVGLLALAVTGCTTYYRIQDPASGRAYYTEEYRRRNGSITFIDAKSRAEITLTSSEVAEISKDEDKKNTAK